ncbi:PCYCGC domain-containing protein [Bacillus sp. FJAT-47783]|uniref:PCYCGC domain-containing protein n=1 Tax=Bacillus sp. FJAT-47783 TaxID=2922712 RepID=UPI001FADDB5E|nr:PCYCGC domain-containing protein [Bacillus sp. FJAT-47783]
MKLKKLVITVVFLAFSVLMGCGHSENSIGHDHTTMPNGDVRETTASVNEYPSFLSEQTEQIQTIYQAAALHEDLLRSMPCYCGCAETAGHRDNFECFVHKIKENGEVVWDDHGTRCKVCLEIAANSILQYEKGASKKEIREQIDERYQEGYADPTPTPMPQA